VKIHRNNLHFWQNKNPLPIIGQGANQFQVKIGIDFISFRDAS
jgi:hypothetical protein